MEDRECRVCDEGEENIHRSLKECRKTKCDIEEREFLREDGVGLEIMKRIEIIKRKDKQGSNVQGRGDKKGLIEL
ncbi:hypothetical protein QLX08_009760 [Tetragonisca angustula]|uniref:Uncharacterized protein n=1 Tax=Tetragonisca angustula TaxID=166442 RepID=A0AAW0ZES7_9HYME